MTSYQNKAGRLKFNQKKDLFVASKFFFLFFFSVEALCVALALKCDGAHVVGEGGARRRARPSLAQSVTRAKCGCAAEGREGDELNLSRC